MNIINLTGEKYPISKQNINVYDDLDTDFSVDCFGGILRWKRGEEVTKEMELARLQRLWNRIPVYLVKEDQANKTIEHNGKRIIVPDFKDPYFSIDEQLNYADDPAEMFQRYYDGIEKMDNETFKENDAEVLRRAFVDKKFFDRYPMPKGCFDLGNGYRRWVTADTFGIYVRDFVYGKSYTETATKPAVFIRMDKIVERAKGNKELIEPNVIAAILRSKLHALMDIDITGHKGTRERNYQLRLLQPAYYRLKEDSLAQSFALGMIAVRSTDEDAFNKLFRISFTENDAANAYSDDYNVMVNAIRWWIDSKTFYAQGAARKTSDIYKTKEFIYAMSSIASWYRSATCRNTPASEQSEILEFHDKEVVRTFARYSNSEMKEPRKRCKPRSFELEYEGDEGLFADDIQDDSTKTPSAMKAYLDQFVIGQDEAKRDLAVAVYNHYKRLEINQYLCDEEKLQKSNVILIGETGSGKTLLAKTIARMLDVPIFIQDCTKITEAGYVGADVEECLSGLLIAAGNKISAAERGIVVLDEVDKIAARDAGVSLTKDVGGEGVQQSLLKLVEGDNVQVQKGGGRRHPEAKCNIINTSDILFICTGAFSGIEEIVRKRTGSTKVGFEATCNTSAMNRDELIQYVTPEDFRQFGMIPEFIGRFPIISNVNKLTEDDLVKILTEPKNSIVRQCQALLEKDNTDLVFTDEALRLVAHTAIMMKTGARGLRGVIETVMRDIMFEAPDNRMKSERTTVTVDEEYIKNKLSRHYLVTSKS